MKRGLLTIAVGTALFRPGGEAVPRAVVSAPTSAPQRAKPATQKPAPPKHVAPLAPLAMLPSIPRVRIEAFPTELLIATDVNLPRGDYAHGALEFYVAFGAPGLPLAVDAQLVSVADGALEAPESASGERLVTRRAPRRPHSAYALLGRETMAGSVVQVPEASFLRALSPGKMATLRVRTIIELPPPDGEGARSVVVRLGASRGTPLTLGRISVVSRSSGQAITRAEARLCGPEAESRPLAVRIAPRPTASGNTSGAQEQPRPIAPVLAVRHGSDDLCVRFWAGPAPR